MNSALQQKNAKLKSTYELDAWMKHITVNGREYDDMRHTE
jgi:hypothetical protein